MTSHESKQPVIGNIQDDSCYSIYSAEEQSKFVYSRASSCKEQRCGNDMENNLVLMLCTPSGIHSHIHVVYKSAHSNIWLRSSFPYDLFVSVVY